MDGWQGSHGHSTVLILGELEEVLHVEALEERYLHHPHVVAPDQGPLVGADLPQMPYRARMDRREVGTHLGGQEAVDFCGKNSSEHRIGITYLSWIDTWRRTH